MNFGFQKGFIPIGHSFGELVEVWEDGRVFISTPGDPAQIKCYRLKKDVIQMNLDMTSTTGGAGKVIYKA